MDHANFLNGEVDKALQVLGEHFDAIQFIGTFVDDEGQTHCLTRGVGNWYARVGAAQEFLERDAAQEFLERDAAQTTAQAIGEAMRVDEEDQ